MSKQGHLEKPVNAARKAERPISLLDFQNAPVRAVEVYGMISAGLPPGPTEISQGISEAALLDSNQATMAMDDPGLQEAIHFGESVRAKTSRVFSPEESRQAWKKNDREIANFQIAMGGKVGPVTW